MGAWSQPLVKVTQLMPWTLKIQFGISFSFEEDRSVGAEVERGTDAFFCLN